MDNGSPDPDARLSLWVRISDSLKSLESLIELEEKALVNDMGKVFDIEEVFSIEPESSEAAAKSTALAGKVVAIYTLTESVAQRVGRLLENCTRTLESSFPPIALQPRGSRRWPGERIFSSSAGGRLPMRPRNSSNAGGRPNRLPSIPMARAHQVF